MRGAFQNFRSLDAFTAAQVDSIKGALLAGESPERLSDRLRADGHRISARTLRRWRADLALRLLIVQASERRAAAIVRLRAEASRYPSAVSCVSNANHFPDDSSR